jgi:uncharacterized protein (TIGR02646 family)
MKKLNREPLSPPTMAVLKDRTQQVLAAADPKEEAQRLWKQQGNKAFEEIRETLKTMASGLERCMYCEDSAGTDIEHFWPKSSYPERAFTWANYLLACSCCNSNYKREQFPVDEAGVPRLIDPTAEDPREYLIFSGRTGKYKPKPREGQASPKGQKSIEVFGLDRDILEKGRRMAWRIIPLLLRDYAEACSLRDWRKALAVQQDLCEYPFASVFVWFIDIASGPQAARFIDERCLSVLDKYPDIKGWV